MALSDREIRTRCEQNEFGALNSAGKAHLFSRQYNFTASIAGLK
jgi:hypothetical protein